MHARNARADHASHLVTVRHTTNVSLRLAQHVIEKRFQLWRSEPLRLRRLVVGVELDAFADQHLHRVAIVRRVVPPETRS